MSSKDNLYRSMALWGLILAAASVLCSFYQVYSFNLNSYEGRAQFTVDLKDRERLLAEHESLLKIEKRSEGGERRLAEVKQQLISVVARVDARIEKADYEMYISGIYTKFGIAGLLIGLLSAGLGFRLWYVRVQKPMDTLLRTQLESEDS